jgi:hypothetical protein
MRLADVCNPHVKDEHPTNRVASGFEPRGPPVSPEDGAYNAATARFGQNSVAPTRVLFPAGLPQNQVR